MHQKLPRLSLLRPWVCWPLLVLWEPQLVHPKHVTRLYEQDSRNQNRPPGLGGWMVGGLMNLSIFLLKRKTRTFGFIESSRFFWLNELNAFIFFWSFREMTEMTLKCAQIQQLVTAWHWQSSINDWKVRKLELLLKRLTKIPRAGTGAEPSSCGRCISVHDGSIGIGVAACAGRSERDSQKCSKFNSGDSKWNYHHFF